MKTIISFLHHVPFLFLLFFLGCNNQEYKSIHVSVLTDVTDSFTVRPDAHSIISLFHLGENPFGECSFRLSNITDRNLNAIVEFSLPGNRIASQRGPFSTEQNILSFYEKIKSSVRGDSLKHTERSLMHSECFATIARELQAISSHQAQESYLLVYSDLRENSRGEFNAYDKRCIKKCMSDPNYLVAFFEKQNLLPEDLHSIDTQFMYYPIDREDDEIYGAIVYAYKIVLEKRGASVAIKANNK